MKKVIVTGSLGLIGFETVKTFLEKGFIVIGIDNDKRAGLFNIKTNFSKKSVFLKSRYPKYYLHYSVDIRDKSKLGDIFKKHARELVLIVHTAAQTSHDWSAKDPETDFSINALGTLLILELCRKHSPKAVFVFTSTNKVYGDLVNSLNYQENRSRFDFNKTNKYYKGIPESFSIDQSKHSPFGASKASADLMVQEYGRYFGLRTGVFRLGVVAGSGQNGAFEQGFLSYMVNVFAKGDIFYVIGYEGKQVRDIVDARDVADAFYRFYRKPQKGGVFNLGGGRANSASVLELIEKVSRIVGRKPKIILKNQARSGDHRWWVSDVSKFEKAYPGWKIRYSIEDIISNIHRNAI